MIRSSSPLPQENEFDEWLMHPVTKAVREFCRLEKERLKEDWSLGAFIADDQFKTAVLNAKAHGYCEAYSVIAELDFHKLIERFEDESEYQRPEAARPSNTG